MKMSFKPEERLIIDQLERYLAGHVLEWRLAFSTPYDFIQLIMARLSEEAPKADIDGIISAATSLCQLFFLCTSSFITHFSL